IFAFGASTASVQSLLNMEADLPGLIQRGPPDASGVGPITFVDLRNLNLNQIASKSIDFSVEQEVGEVGGGRLLVSAAATKNISFRIQAPRSSPAQETVRNPSSTFSASEKLKWNGNAQVRWEGPRWGVGWSTRYFDWIPVPQPAAVPTTYFLLQG